MTGNNIFKTKFKFISRSTWILVAIVLLGIFLRTYHFREWLYFSADQVRDTVLVKDVINGKSDWPIFGAHMNHTEFLLGPMYYYFQIISAKFFGSEPETMAYPDLFFSILSIPLLYLFLRRFFKANLSLALTGLYAISAYSIQYARFALNSNPIPFFALLFLLSLSELIYAKEKTSWWWIFFLGVAGGVGVQLHAIILILWLLIMIVTSIYLLWRNKDTWKKIAAVFLFIFILNATQIAADLENNFSNVKSFFASSQDKTSDTKSGSTEKFVLGADCQNQSFFYIASSLGEPDECNFRYNKMLGNKGIGYLKKLAKNDMVALPLLAGEFLFSLGGYGLLIYYFKKEQDKRKKYLLGLIIAYASLSFLVMLPIATGLRLRYYIHLIFLPFLFLGFFLKYLFEKFPKRGFVIASLVFALFVWSNLFSLVVTTEDFFAQRKSHNNYAVLGEVDAMLGYMELQGSPQREFYYFGKASYIWTLFDALEYESRAKKITLIRAMGRDNVEVIPGKPVFYISGSSKENDNMRVENRKVEAYRNFGQFGIYKLENR